MGRMPFFVEPSLRMKILCPLILIGMMVLMPHAAPARTDLWAEWIATDPLTEAAELSSAERIRTYEEHLAEAVKATDAKMRFFALLHLYYELMRANDHVEAKKYVLSAQLLADSIGDPAWRGFASYHQGILSTSMKNYRDAVGPYIVGAELCRTGGDSTCWAECLEQLGIVHAQLNDYEESRRYYAQALPLVEKYCDQKAQAATLANYGGMLTRSGSPAEALPYLERSLALMREQGAVKQEAQVMNNMAEAYLRTGRHKAALTLFRTCMRMNTANGHPESMVNNLEGIAEVYLAMGRADSATAYLREHFALKDSLFSRASRSRIAELEASYEQQRQELELERTRTLLADARGRFQQAAWLFSVALLLILFGIWRWWSRNRRARKELQQDQEELEALARLLREKNAVLLRALERTGTPPTDESAGLEENVGPDEIEEEGTTDATELTFHDQRILTDSDWAAFKVKFEKAFPGTLYQLRTAFPSITNAEERLFLFIKLKLNTREAADILGISPASVKRARNRLRKRLELEEGTDLDAFVRSFTGRGRSGKGGPRPKATVLDQGNQEARP